MRTISVISLLILAIVCCCSFMAGPEPDCMDLFNRAFGKMKNMDPKLNKGIALKYAVTVQTVEGETYTDNVDLHIYNNRASIVSQEATIYQDEKTMVVIRPEASTIYMTKPADETLRKTKFQDIMRLQDSVFSKMILKQCVTESSGLKKLTFQFPAQVQNKIGIASANYWVDEKQISIRKLQLVYKKREGQQLNNWTMEFLHWDTKYARAPFEGSALSKVYDSRHTLKDTYRNYSVVDRR